MIILNFCFNLISFVLFFSALLCFSLRMILLPLINLVLKNSGHSTADYVTEKILTKSLPKCKSENLGIIIELLIAFTSIQLSYNISLCTMRSKSLGTIYYNF